MSWAYLSDLQPGDQMFGPISGATGVFVGAGMVAVAPWKHRLSWKTWWRIRHCATVTQAAGASMIGPDRGSQVAQTMPMVAQAMPSGYEEREIGAEHWTSDYVYIRPKWLHAEQAEVVAELAREMARRKIPYAFEDYAAIAAHRAGLPVPHLDDFISRTDADGYPLRSICSQGCDAQMSLSGGLVLDDAGLGHVFADGRLAQDVVPAELYLLLLTLPGSKIIRPGWTEVTATGRLGTIPGAML